MTQEEFEAELMILINTAMNDGLPHRDIFFVLWLGISAFTKGLTDGMVFPVEDNEDSDE